MGLGSATGSGGWGSKLGDDEAARGIRDKPPAQRAPALSAKAPWAKDTTPGQVATPTSTGGGTGEEGQGEDKGGWRPGALTAQRQAGSGEWTLLHGD
jgi:hypothetical protein